LTLERESVERRGSIPAPVFASDAELDLDALVAEDG
jgi:hypothetical protein